MIMLCDRFNKAFERKGGCLCFEDPNDFAVEVYARSEEQK